MTSQADVVVVGGGPTGLMAACELALVGIRVTVLERRVDRVPQSRALTLHPRSLEIFALRGIADRFISQGMRVPTGHYAMLDTRLDFSALDTSYPFTLFLPQTTTERLLEAYALELGVDVRRGHHVQTLEQHEDSVRVSVTPNTGSPYILCSAYVIGADGARSVVRREAGIAFLGMETNSTFYMGDVALAAPPSAEMSVVRNEAGSVTIVPLDQVYYRVICNDPSRLSVSVTEPVTLEELEAGVRRIFGRDIGMTRPRWLSRFGNETRLASCYRRGRVFLAGDAAHIHMPAGGQGLNVGLQDAMNLGWKLGGVLRGFASVDLLDSYDRERRPVGAALLENTLAQTHLMTTFNREGFALRETMNRLLHLPAVNRQLAEDLAAFSVSYPHPIFSDHPVDGILHGVGCRLANADLQVQGQQRSLYGLFHQGQWVHLQFSSHAVSSTPRGLDPRWIESVRAVPLSSSPLFAWETVLVRPDGHIASATPRMPGVECGFNPSMQHL
ncbi:FAD-dependent oxidoreductase [Burkholderia territorii]|uniref:FAD-dependent oxidoreductase n=1 Tax=Burkholderia territorii TaxID=1503055 RepID=UPI0009BFA982|nr:FAD-dependent oxidoreductase [Burkholderia territorii]